MKARKIISTLAKEDLSETVKKKGNIYQENEDFQENADDADYADFHSV